MSFNIGVPAGGGGVGIYYNETIQHPSILTQNAGSAFTFNSFTRNVPMILNVDTILSAIHINVSSASTGNAIFGLYKWDGNAGQTFDKVYQENTLFNLAITGPQSITLLTPQTLAAGDVYMGIILVENNVQLYNFTNHFVGKGMLGRNVNFTDIFNGLIVSTPYTTTMPSTLTFSVEYQSFQGPNTMYTLQNA